MAPQDKQAYCTLVMSDSYLPGAIVLVRSLRSGGTAKQLAVLVTPDTLSVETVSELQELYDHVIPVPRLGNPEPANLYRMDRGDLAYTFTKVALWRLLQFRKVVYIDADVLALRAPDELFDVEAPFAAVPDSGWPDCFNSGVMVVSPNMEDHHALQALAASGSSFDGADQGLLNEYYASKGWGRLSFLYNCTLNAQYQWEPAFRHHRAGITLVHFIGKEKPWCGGPRPGRSSGVYDELSARWRAVYDGYLEEKLGWPTSDGRERTCIVLQSALGAIQGASSSTAADSPLALDRATGAQPSRPADEPTHQPLSPRPKRRVSLPRAEWDATLMAPPADSQPEAPNFPNVTYSFSEDHRLFQPPAAYPEPPEETWCEMPASKPVPQEAPKPIFPWEGPDRSKATRVFAEDLTLATPGPRVDVAAASEPDASTVSSPPSTPEESHDPWRRFGQTHTNAWDGISGIQQYVQAVIDTQTKCVRPTGMSLDGVAREAGGQRGGSLILTDFPSEAERPSLPVTPAPVRRSSFWGDELNEASELPAAEGVPSQAEWVSGEFAWACPRCGYRSVALAQSRPSPPSLPQNASSASVDLAVSTLELPVHLVAVKPASNASAADDEHDGDGEPNADAARPDPVSLIPCRL